MPRANELVKALECQLLDWRDQDITSVVCDSRQATPGSLYVAYGGVSVDGHDYASAAYKAGAVAFVLEHDLPELVGQPRAIVRSGREAFARLQAALHGYPGRHLKVIGVTGTDGKTTTSRLIASILSAAGKQVGTVDTVGATIAGKETPTGFHTTTPDAPELQEYLAQMVTAGVEYAVIETTSHGLAQHRVTGSEYDVAVVTNITHEHLDFHGTFENYREAKAMLFRSLATSAHKEGIAKTAVLNRDDPSYAYLAALSPERQYAYGIEQGDVTASDIQCAVNGLNFTLVLPDEQQLTIHSPLVGRYNISNILAAATATWSLGISGEAISKGVAAVGHIEGRWNVIECGQPFSVVVDFAHTPNALQQVLTAARQLTSGRIAVVFGCAGLRDRAKRPAMGKIAGELADLVVLTAEDPRTESLDTIIEQIVAGIETDVVYWREPDRAKAIARALEWAKPGDLVIVTGKGHEQSMCFGTVETPWSDKEAVLHALATMGYC